MDSIFSFIVGLLLFIGLIGDLLTTLEIKKHPNRLYERNPFQRKLLKKGLFGFGHILILILGEVVLFTWRNNEYVILSVAILGCLLIFTVFHNISEILALHTN
jgi:hypothetical protein